MSGTLGQWRWSSDDYSITISKEAHFALCLGLYYFFVHFWVSEMWASIVTLLIGLVREIKDGLVPEEDYGIWGGSGFSYWDLMYDAIGIVLGLVIDLIWPPHIRPRREQPIEEIEEEVDDIIW